MLALLLSLALVQTTDLDSRHAERDRFEAVLAAAPTDAAAQEGEVRISEQLALADRAAGDFNAAIGELLRGKRFVPESPRLLYDTGVLEEQIGLFQDAKETVEDLRKLLPGDEKTLYLASHIELDLGRLAEAEADMRAYLKLQPEDASAHYGLGRILQQAQQGFAAHDEFERSIQLKPLQTEAYYQLGQLDLEAGDFEAVLREDSEVLARDPRHGGACTGIGVALFRLKRYARSGTSIETRNGDCSRLPTRPLFLRAGTRARRQERRLRSRTSSSRETG